MKWLFLGIGVVLAAAGILTAVKMYRDTIPEETDDIDGGVVRHNDGSDAPKEIESTKITEFHCEFSLLASAEPGELDNRIYSMDAVYKDETVYCTYERYGRGTPSENVTFETDLSFLESLQQVVSKHDLAAHNGYVHTVSGLPDMYGARLDIHYASGESIYAHNNQSCFLSYDAMHDLAVLFGSMNEQ